MHKDSGCCSEHLVPDQPIPAGAHDFSKRMRGLLDGQPKDEKAVTRALEDQGAMLDVIAARLYSMASMLVVAGEAGVRLVETAVATAEVSACHEPAAARQNSRRSLARAAVRLLVERTPGCLNAPMEIAVPHTCIESEELDAAGVSNEVIETMIAGPDRERVRTWLESLPVVQRVVFVLRAVAAIPAQETAELLAAHGGPGAAAWTADSVREVFRQALCSLASQLLHETHAH